jgi:ribosome maturation protein Sdo1
MSRDKICTDVEIEEVINFSKIFESLKKNEKAQKDYHLYG